MRRKLVENLRRVKDRIAAACDRGQRDPAGVRLVAVTKSVEIDVIRQLLDMGVADLGESRVQQFVKRAGMIHEFASRQRFHKTKSQAKPTWHLVGSLQRNKVKSVLPYVDMIHSIDNLRLGEDVDAAAGRLGVTVEVLLQVNTSGEKSKHGVAVGAAAHVVEQMSELSHLRICGLMTMAPLTEDVGVQRAAFRRLREVSEDIVTEGIGGEDFRHLSMGMSSDFEVAVEEGSTIVRIGAALFEGLPTEAAAASDGVA